MKENIYFICLYEASRTSNQTDSCGTKRIKPAAFSLWCSSGQGSGPLKVGISESFKLQEPRGTPVMSWTGNRVGVGRKSQQSSCSWIEGCQQQFPKLSSTASHRNQRYCLHSLKLNAKAWWAGFVISETRHILNSSLEVISSEMQQRVWAREQR